MTLNEVQNELRRLQYKELQAIAKSKSIRANRKKEELVESVAENMSHQEREDFLLKAKLEKETLSVERSIPIKKERRSMINYNYESRLSTISRERRHMKHFERSNHPWKIATGRKPSPVRSDSPLFSQFVRSDDLPRLEDSDLKEIDDGYVPNGTFVEDFAWSAANSSQNQINNCWGTISSPLNCTNNTWNQGPQKYGHNRWALQNFVKNPQILYPQEHYRNYMPQAQQHSFGPHLFSTNFGYRRTVNDYSFIKSVRPFQNHFHNSHGPFKRFIRPRLSLDQVHQWSDVMTSPRDPLIGSCSAQNPITFPNITDQRQGCFNLGEAIKTADLDNIQTEL